MSCTIHRWSSFPPSHVCSCIPFVSFLLSHNLYLLFFRVLSSFALIIIYSLEVSTSYIYKIIIWLSFIIFGQLFHGISTGLADYYHYHYYYYYYYSTLLRFFHTSASWWSFTGDWVTVSFLKSPGLFSVFWPFSIIMLFGRSPHGRQLPNPPGPLIIL